MKLPAASNTTIALRRRAAAGELPEQLELIVRQRQAKQCRQEYPPHVPGFGLKEPAEHPVVIDGADDVDGRHGEPSLAASSAARAAV